VRVLLSGPGADRPGTTYIGRVASMDYSGVQVLGRWHRKALRDDGHKEVPVGPSDGHTFFPWTSLDYIEILPESDDRENDFAQRYRQGVEALKAKDFASSIRLFREALSLKPEDQKARYYLEEAERLAQS